MRYQTFDGIIHYLIRIPVSFKAIIISVLIYPKDPNFLSSQIPTQLGGKLNIHIQRHSFAVPSLQLSKRIALCFNFILGWKRHWQEELFLWYRMQPVTEFGRDTL